MSSSSPSSFRPAESIKLVTTSKAARQKAEEQLQLATRNEAIAVKCNEARERIHHILMKANMDSFSPLLKSMPHLDSHSSCISSLQKELEEAGYRAPMKPSLNWSCHPEYNPNCTLFGRFSTDRNGENPSVEFSWEDYVGKM
jgi:hypothetical protein